LESRESFHLKAVDGLGNFEDFAGELLGLLVAGLADDDRLTATRLHLLDGVDGLHVDAVAHHNHDDWHEIVDEGEWSVLQLSGHDSLAMHVRQLFHFLRRFHEKPAGFRSKSTYQRSLHASGEVVAAAHDQQALLLVQVAGDVQNLRVELQHFLDLFVEFTESCEDFLATSLEGDAVLAHDEPEHHQRDELRGVGLGGGDSDLGAGIDVHTAVGFTADGASDGVGDADDESTALFAIAQRHQSVGGLA
jgi:hypothetical protein